MRHRCDVGSRAMNATVDRKRSRIYGIPTLENATVVIDQQKIGHANLTEMHRKWIDPEAIWEFRVARGYVSRNTVAKTKLCKYAACAREALLAMATLGINAGETRRPQEGLMLLRQGLAVFPQALFDRRRPRLSVCDHLTPQQSLRHVECLIRPGRSKGCDTHVSTERPTIKQYCLLVFLSPYIYALRLGARSRLAGSCRAPK